MDDRFWVSVERAVEPLLRPDDVVLAPVGGWRCRTGSWRLYRGAIRLEGATVLLLHKGQMAAIRRPDLGEIWQHWQCVYANTVFVCFATGRRVRLDSRLTPRRIFTRKLEDYLASKRLKRQPSTIYFLHTPKTAGTSVWHALGQRVRAKLYYDCNEAFLFNPPGEGEFDLVGGHVWLQHMLPCLRPGDHLVGLLREPTARFRSAFLHSRRVGEDSATFTPVMRAMRDMDLASFLPTMAAQMELRQQMLMLGFGFDRPYTPALDPEIFAAAVALIERPDVLLFPGEQIRAFTRRVCTLLGIKPVKLQRLNASDRGQQAASQQEFERAMPLIEAGNQRERALYARVIDNAARARQWDMPSK